MFCLEVQIGACAAEVIEPFWRWDWRCVTAIRIRWHIFMRHTYIYETGDIS